MGLIAEREDAIRVVADHAKPLGGGLRLAVSSAADVCDPLARHASVLQRIKETTAFHWGMGVADRTTQQLALDTFKPVCHRATVWFAY